MAEKRITKGLLDAARLSPPTVRRRIFDTELPGFLVTLHPSGRAIFAVRYVGRDARRFTTVGTFGTLTLEQARVAGRKLLAEAQLGNDPAEAKCNKKAAERTALTFEKWAVDYLKSIEKARKRMDHIRGYVERSKVAWAGRKLAAISPDDVRASYQTISEKAPVAANRWLATIAALFREAVDRGLIPTNPAVIKARFRNKEGEPRSRFLFDPETVRLNAAIPLEDEPVRTAFQLLLENGNARERGAECAMGGSRLRVADMAPTEKTKSGRPQTIHLAAETVAWLRATPRAGAFLVPGPSPLKRRHSLRSAWVRVAERAGLEGVHLHDLRRSFGRRVTLMAGLHAAQLALRHSRPEVTSRVYAPMLGSEQSDTIAKVVPLMRGRKPVAAGKSQK